MLEKDAPQGIADECIYGNMYFEYSGEEMTGRLVPFRQIKVVAPEDLTGSENLSRFKWSVVSDGDIATIDENGMITFSEFEKGVRKNVKVTAEAKDSPYAGDSIKREYNFTVMYGVNVETADELTKAVNEEIDGKKHEVFLRNDITIAPSDIPKPTQVAFRAKRAKKPGHGATRRSDFRQVFTATGIRLTGNTATTTIRPQSRTSWARTYS